MKAKRKPFKTRELTPAQKRFAHAFAGSNNATKATREAFPLLKSSTRQSLAVKGHRMLNNVNVLNEIQDQKARLAVIASKAVNKIGQLVDSDKEGIALDASKYAIDQSLGKATVKIEQKSAHVQVIYNLGGSDAPPIPKEIQEKLQKG